MSQARTESVPESLIRDLSGSDSPWAVILFNDEFHTFDEVAYQLREAIGCSLEAGYALATEVHTTGRANVFEGDLTACEAVAAVLERIALQVKLQVM